MRFNGEVQIGGNYNPGVIVLRNDIGEFSYVHSLPLEVLSEVGVDGEMFWDPFSPSEDYSTAIGEVELVFSPDVDAEIVSDGITERLNLLMVN